MTFELILVSYFLPSNTITCHCFSFWTLTVWLKMSEFIYHFNDMCVSAFTTKQQQKNPKPFVVMVHGTKFTTLPIYAFYLTPTPTWNFFCCVATIVLHFKHKTKTKIIIIFVFYSIFLFVCLLELLCLKKKKTTTKKRIQFICECIPNRQTFILYPLLECTTFFRFVLLCCAALHLFMQARASIARKIFKYFAADQKSFLSPILQFQIFSSLFSSFLYNIIGSVIVELMSHFTNFIIIHISLSWEKEYFVVVVVERNERVENLNWITWVDVRQNLLGNGMEILWIFFVIVFEVV